MKQAILFTIGVIAGMISDIYGGWNAVMATLVTFMAIDYITGLIVAGVFKNSKKTESGALESRAGFKGLCRKGMCLLIVLVGARLDTLFGSNFIRDATCVAFCANEAISITENAGLMGVPIPSAIKKAIDALQKAGEQDGNQR